MTKKKIISFLLGAVLAVGVLGGCAATTEVQTTEENTESQNDTSTSGKTVIPFATSSSSGMGESGEILESYAGTGNWLEGRRFQSNEDVANAREWAASLAQ